MGLEALESSQCPFTAVGALISIFTACVGLFPNPFIGQQRVQASQATQLQTGKIAKLLNSHSSLATDSNGDPFSTGIQTD